MPRRSMLVQWYGQYLSDHDLGRFLAKVAEAYTLPTVCHLLSTGDVASRRASLLALGWLAGTQVQNHIGRALRDRDRGVRLLAVTLLPEVWLRAAGPASRHAILQIRRWNSSAQFAEAEEAAIDLLRRFPEFDEAQWQIVVARLGRGHTTTALRGCRKILTRNRYFFPAAVELGRCLSRRGATVAAIASFRRALRICPELESVRMQIRKLERERRT